MKKILAWFLLMFSMTLVAHASDVNWKAPTTYTTLTSTAVNISYNVSNTDNSELTFNVSIWNKSSSSGTYGRLDWMTVANGSFANITKTLTEERHWIHMNVTNSTAVTSSTAIIFDIDVNYYVLVIGGYQKINMSLDEGDINISGGLYASELRLNNNSLITEPCTASTQGLHGVIRYNTTGIFYGCTPAGWKNLSSSSG